ncbi:MAG: SDR family oxidoreductase [Acidimicrobiia bacterium]|nr:SDR family oxidoreductase [Acidimicrobiia bacterium]
MLLQDKVAIVTGVGPGLGQATAVAFAREGAAVGLAARSEERLAGVAAEIDDLGGRSLAVPTDVTDPDACRRLVESTVAEFGGLDCVVNSAFHPDLYGPFEQVDLKIWRDILEVNLFGALHVTQAAIPHLKKRDSASIVNVGSMSARKIRGEEGGYATSKGALHTATQVLARELAPDGIRVNTVVPGWIWGPSVQIYVGWQAESRGVPESEIVAEVESRIPLGFIPPQDDVANAIVFFASDMSRVITGQALDVNGGEYFH